MRLLAAPPAAFAPFEGGRWKLVETGAGLDALEPVVNPFVIGRSPDCDLVLPAESGSGPLTSRWHCHLVKVVGRWCLADGAPPRAGEAVRPSRLGTYVNSKKVEQATPLADGDRVEVGGWTFTVDTGTSAQVLDATELLQRVAAGEARAVAGDDPRVHEQFGKLHSLVRQLAGTPGIDESLKLLLEQATERIPAANVGAILLASPRGAFETRLAWRKGAGTLHGFRFSNALLASLPPERSFLLRSKVEDATVPESGGAISSGLLLPLWGKGDRLGVLYLDNRESGQSFQDSDLYIASALASLISLQLSLEKQTAHARIEENMARYFAPDVVQRIIERSSQIGTVGLEVEEREVSVLFVDMEGFTAISRSMSPRRLSEMLNPYLETVATSIQEAGGHVNKFIGDAVLGIFGAQPDEPAAADSTRSPPAGKGGAPSPRSPSASGRGTPRRGARHAVEALRAALAIPAAWQAAARSRGLPEQRLRIGLSAGAAVVGNIGYATRLEYSVLGDVVNLASRLEKLAPPGRAACSEALRDLAADQFEFEDLGAREIKGVGHLRIFSPLRERK